MSWLADQIRALEKMQSEATEHAEDVVAAKAVPEKKTASDKPTIEQKAKETDGEDVDSMGDEKDGDVEGAQGGAESSAQSEGRHEDTWESALSPDRDVKAKAKEEKSENKAEKSTTTAKADKQADTNADAKKSHKQKSRPEDRKSKKGKKLGGEATSLKSKNTEDEGAQNRTQKLGADIDEKNGEKIVAESDGETKKKSADETKLFVQSKSPKPKSPPIIMTGVTDSDAEEIKETAPLGLRALPRPVETKAVDTSALFSEDAPHVKKSEKELPRDTSESIIEISTDELETQSDTMPVDIVDIMEMSDDDGKASDLSDLSNAPVLPPIPMKSTGLQRFKWPIIAGVLLLLLGVSIYSTSLAVQNIQPLTKKRAKQTAIPLTTERRTRRLPRGHCQLMRTAIPTPLILE